jgi:excisionase family DNA binding protein
MSINEVAERLGLHYMTVYRYVRTGRLPAVKNGAEWWIDPVDVARLRGAQSPRPTRGAGRGAAAARLRTRLVAGDEPGAWGIVERSMGSGMAPEGVLLGLVAPVLEQIGDGWADGDLTIADEHRASGVALRVVGRMGPRFVPRGRKRGSIVLAAPSGELHGIPVAMAANVLRWHGYSVNELGPDTPAVALEDAAMSEAGLLAIGLVCTASRGIGSLRRAVSTVRRARPDVPVIVGGRGIVDEEHARSFGATAYSGRRADELLAVIEGVVAARR